MGKAGGEFELVEHEIRQSGVGRIKVEAVRDLS